MASVAARSAASLSPRPTKRAADSAAASVTRTTSSARFLSMVVSIIPPTPPDNGDARRVFSSWGPPMSHLGVLFAEYAARWRASLLPVAEPADYGTVVEGGREYPLLSVEV